MSEVSCIIGWCNCSYKIWFEKKMNYRRKEDGKYKLATEWILKSTFCFINVNWEYCIKLNQCELNQ